MAQARQCFYLATNTKTKAKFYLYGPNNSIDLVDTLLTWIFIGHLADGESSRPLLEQQPEQRALRTVYFL